MRKLASWKSSKFVKARLQAALYYARKRRKQRQAEQPAPKEPDTGE